MPSLRRLRADHVYLLAGALACAAYLVLPTSIGAERLYVAIAISMPVVAIVGLRRDQPKERGAWLTLIVGLALNALGELLYNVLVQTAGSDSWATPTDFVFLVAYATQAVGLIALIAERSTGRSRSSWLDAGAIGIAVVIVLWGTIEQAIVDRAGSSVVEWILQLGFPILGATLIFMSARLLLGEGRWRRSFSMLTVGYVLQTTTDLIANLAEGYAVGSAVDTLWAVGYVLTGAALLHPDRLGGPRPVPTLQARRDVNQVLAIQGLVVLVMMGVIAGNLLRSTPRSTVIGWAVAGAAMLTLNRIRVYHLLREVSDASITEHSRRLSALVENSNEVIGLVDGDGIIRFVAGGLEDMTGVTPDWWLGKHLPTVVAKHVPGIDELFGQLDRLLDGGSASWEGEYRIDDATEPKVIRITVANHFETPEVNGWVVSIRNVTDEARLTNELRHQALHDSLTGLPNRDLLSDRISHAGDRGRRSGDAVLSVLLVDLDDFKSVNDSLGHNTGDELLTRVAARLTEAVRPADTVARLGGDEFAVLLEDTGEREASIVARRIIDALAMPLQVGGSDFAIQASIGLVTSDHLTSPVDLLRAADIAMYAAKREGKARVSVFRDHMHDAAKQQLALRLDLGKALARDELSLVYQPIVDTGAREIRGFEALLRWTHPDHGAVPPIDFIPVAEQTGLIGPIGAWVLTTACEEAATWGTGADSPYVSVNVSALQLRDPEFVALVSDVVRTTGLAASRLLLEITESVLIDETPSTREALTQVRALGVRIAIDDFGTGYSSLAYLRELAIDVVKIDRLFIRDLAVNPDHRALTSTMLALADGLSMTAIAEGVETDLELGELRHLGCEFAQGYLFSRPVPASRIAPMLANFDALDNTPIES